MGGSNGDKSRLDLRGVKKGLSAFHIVIVALVAIGVCIIFVVLFFSDIVQIDIIVKSGEIERHTVNMAHAFLSWHRIAYKEQVGGADRFYRGIFDKNRLDAEFNTASGANVKTEMMYPQSFSYIYVDDLETSNSPDWSFSWTTPGYNPPDQPSPFVRVFPVAIKVGGDMHMGRLTIGLKESVEG